MSTNGDSPLNPHDDSEVATLKIFFLGGDSAEVDVYGDYSLGWVQTEPGNDETAMIGIRIGWTWRYPDGARKLQIVLQDFVAAIVEVGRMPAAEWQRVRVRRIMDGAR